MTRRGPRRPCNDLDGDDHKRCVPDARVRTPAPEADQAAMIFKALSSPVRLRLLATMQVAVTGEACVCDLADGAKVSQSTASHHLGVLVAAGVAHRRRRGTWAWYSLAPGGLDAARTLVAEPAVPAH
jgi:ArsR family transcriptional regulator